MRPQVSTPPEAARRALRLRDRLLSHAAFAALAAESARAPDLDLHLVGGAPRDLLIGREPADLDFALASDPTPIVARIRERAGGTVVALDEDRATLRLVSPGEGAPVLDFARLRATTIEDDARCRDLTINAIAIPLRPFLATGEVRWIDPTGGMRDLASGVIRFASPRSPIDDPLRLLRAYRFACELEFSIDERTREIARETAEGIRATAPERISYELLRILASPRPAWALADLDRVGLLARLVPEVDEMRGVVQNTYHHLDVLGHSLLTVFEMERILAEPGAIFPRWAQPLVEYVGGRQRRPMLLAAALLHDVGKPRCRAVDAEGRVTFYGHAEVGEQIATAVLRQLRLPSRHVELAALWVGHHMRLANHQRLLAEGRLQDRSLFRTFRKLGEEVIGEIILTLADRRATLGPEQDPASEGVFVALGERMLGLYFDRFVAERSKPRLVTGHDLMGLGLAEGPEIGRILREIEDALLDGRVADREQALALARELVARRRPLADEVARGGGES